MNRPLCRHCHAKPANRSRGLCYGCFHAPDIRAMYPPDSKYAGKAEPTEAELEAMIAEQLPTMPGQYWERK